MMADQLKSVIEDLVKSEICSQIDENKIAKQITVEKTIFKIEMEILPSFPFSFPIVRVSTNCEKGKILISHMGNDGTLCLFDKSTAFPDFREPLHLISTCFNRAESIIRESYFDPINGILDEFNAYWNIGGDSIEAYMFNEISNPICELSAQIAGEKVYISSSRKQVSDIISKLGCVESRKLRCICITLDSPVYPPFPKNISEAFKLIQDKSSNFDLYKTFLGECLPNEQITLFRFVNKGSYIVQGWIYPKILLGIDGFRKGHEPIEMLFAVKNRSSVIMKLNLIDSSQERLFYRGGNGENFREIKIVVLGCGSIGSHFVGSLASASISNFVLVDNELLSVENIARHLCGFSHVGFRKVKAVQNVLYTKNPNILCEIYFEDVLNFIDLYIDSTKDSTFILITLGSIPLEYRIIDIFNKREITSPIIFTWVEPFCFAGHMIVLNQPQDIFRILFDEKNNFSYRKSVVKNPGEFIKRESGCQASFMPYSGLEMEIFVTTMTRLIIDNHIVKKLEGNYEYTWIGQLSKANLNDVEIEPSWRNKEEYSIHVERID